VNAGRVTDILAALWARCPDGAGLSDALVELCARSLPVSGAGMALMTDDGPAGTVAASDEIARELEELQFSLGEGPCVDASRSGRPVLVPDLARHPRDRWPAFADSAHGVGLRAVFAFPLRVGGIRLGVLDLYRASTGMLAASDLADALAFADAATLLLMHLDADGLDDRAEVHQATGVVSVQAGVDLATALSLLRARAFAEQRAIRLLAQDVLDGTVRFGKASDDR
jgi:GAF domain-containing protein